MVVPQIVPGKLIEHSIREIYVGKSKDTLDSVGEHSLGVKEVTGMFGHFVKYRVNNTEMMLQCEECGQWRLIYARKKLTHTQKQQLERVLDHISFSCGTQLQDYSDLPQDMMDTVFTRNLDCNEPVERLYYSAKFADICIHCSSESVSPWNDTEDFYPQCENCSEKSKIPNVKAQTKKTSTK